jgi:hypothetical protein
MVASRDKNACFFDGFSRRKKSRVGEALDKLTAHGIMDAKFQGLIHYYTKPPPVVVRFLFKHGFDPYVYMCIYADCYFAATDNPSVVCAEQRLFSFDVLLQYGLDVYREFPRSSGISLLSLVTIRAENNKSWAAFYEVCNSQELIQKYKNRARACEKLAERMRRSARYKLKRSGIDQTCDICDNDIDKNDDVIDMVCGHSSFCVGCMETWLATNFTCPMCRRDPFI